MNKMKSVFLASLFVTGLAQAAGPCEDFKLILKNDLGDNLVVRDITLHGGQLQPNTIQKLDAHSQSILTVNNALDKGMLTGYITFDTVTIPVKQVKIGFNLDNSGLMCGHSFMSKEGELNTEYKNDLLGKETTYTIKSN